MKTRTLLGILLLAALMLTTGCGKEKATSTETRRVLTQTVTGNNAATVTTYPGRTQASEEANVAFRVAGTLLRVTVKEGDRVRHRIFGPGTIRGVDPDKSAYIIRFDDLDTDRQITFRAKLEKI